VIDYYTKQELKQIVEYIKHSVDLAVVDAFADEAKEQGVAPNEFFSRFIERVLRETQHAFEEEFEHNYPGLDGSEIFFALNQYFLDKKLEQTSKPRIWSDDTIISDIMENLVDWLDTASLKPRPFYEYVMLNVYYIIPSKVASKCNLIKANTKKYMQSNMPLLFEYFTQQQRDYFVKFYFGAAKPSKTRRAFDIDVAKVLHHARSQAEKFVNEAIKYAESYRNVDESDREDYYDRNGHKMTGERYLIAVAAYYMTENIHKLRIPINIYEFSEITDISDDLEDLKFHFVDMCVEEMKSYIENTNTAE
jgi:hypothetical protein